MPVRVQTSTRHNLPCLFRLTAENTAELKQRLFARPDRRDSMTDGASVLEYWSYGDCTLAVETPLPFARLLLGGQCPSLMFLGRWQCSQRLFPSWPPAHYFQWSLGHMLQPPPSWPLLLGTETFTRLGQIADRLRKIAPLLADSADENNNSLLSLLERDVATLDALGLSMTCPELLSSGGLAGGTRRYHITGIRLIHAACFAMTLRSKSNIVPAMREALQLALPPLVKEGVLHLLDGDKLQVPKKSMMYHYLFTFDAALARSTWDRFKNRELVFLWADSSPHGGRNWLHTLLHVIPFGEAARCARAVDLLARGHEVNDVEEGSEAKDDTLESLTLMLCKTIVCHHPIPTALASRAEGLFHKMAALLHSLRMGVPDAGVGALRALLENVVSITTDLGTEAKLSDASEFRTEDWVSDSLAAPHSLEPDGGVCMSVVERPVPSSEPGYVFPNCIGWPGLLHIVDGMTHAVHEKAMKNFGWFEKGLTAICALLCRKHRRERFVERCLRSDAVGVHFVKQFRKQFAGVASWRVWGSLQAVLSWLLPLRRPLCRFWSAAKYYRGSEFGDQKS